VRYLVRHADAGDKRAWTGSDGDRPLSSTGRREAEGLIAQLAGRPITEIISSPAVRCLQTVLPLADERGLPVRTDALLAVDADVGRAVDLLLDSNTGDVVLCTHRELIAPLLARLRDGGAPISDQVTLPKGSVWQLEADDGAITNATYLPPVQR
jgi:broad specificity phosphatase PhoE